MKSLKQSFCWEVWVDGTAVQAFRDKGQAKKFAKSWYAVTELRRPRKNKGTFHVGARDRK